MGKPGEVSRVYVDMVGDLFHAGHVALLLREARRHGDWQIVGVLSDETAASPTLSMGIASSCMTAPPCFPDARRGDCTGDEPRSHPRSVFRRGA